ncbi:hypothetical protein QDR98_17245, partial [Acinetobacter baumannii]|uniref:hypothetical protein n=1 Tax=Acinetobacter baumannii TaxID=470 RepID=UPI00244D721B
MDKFNEWFDSKYPNFSANQDNEFCKTAKDFAYVAFQHQQAKVEELQKRVQFLEQELGAWKGKSIAAMINGMCKQCGKEPWQAIVSDKEGYALLHCFGCGANKYELVGEQALKGGRTVNNEELAKIGMMFIHWIQ